MTPKVFYQERYGNDCNICSTYTLHKDTLVIITSYSSSNGEDIDIEKYNIKDYRRLNILCLLDNPELKNWIEAVILEYL